MDGGISAFLYPAAGKAWMVISKDFSLKHNIWCDISEIKNTIGNIVITKITAAAGAININDQGN